MGIILVSMVYTILCYAYDRSTRVIRESNQVERSCDFASLAASPNRKVPVSVTLCTVQSSLDLCVTLYINPIFTP